MPYEITLNNFSGPLQKLYELISEKKYDISSVSLAKVTGDFLDYVSSLGSADPRVISEFIAVAAKMILIKSKMLLPDIELTAEEEGDIKDLEARLNLYKQFKDAEAGFKKMLLAGRHSFAKEPSRFSGVISFYPPPGLSADMLSVSIASLRESVSACQKEYEKYEAINFDERIENFFERVRGRVMEFGDISKGQEKKEVIIMFLALLHLLRDCKVSVEQKDQFSNIIIKCSNE